MPKINIKKLPQSMLEIEGELEADIFESFYSRALKKIGDSMEISGFRKGKVPENVLLNHAPESKILEEMAELALEEHYPKILEEHKIDAISRPEVSITKLARKNSLGFKIRTAVLPEVKLPDYKKIAKSVLGEAAEEEKNVVVTEEDLDSTIMDIRKSRAPHTHVAEGVDGKEAKEELPEWNDEFVKTLGPFKDVADFREKLKINIKLEKENLQKEKVRLNIMERIIEKTGVDLPEILINVEVDKILYRMESDITTMGLKFEDYLGHLKKTREDLRKEFRKDAEKKAALALILNAIAKEENIAPDAKQLEEEVKGILDRYKDADPERARMHAENILTNEKIFQFLESQGAYIPSA